MQAIELLHNRVSCAQLSAPAPSAQQLEIMYQAAARAPDHGCLKPWRLIVLEAEQLVKLGAVFLQVQLAKAPDMAIEKQQKIATKTLRAPMIIAVIATVTAHPKVPEIEQLLSAGCAAHALELAAFAQGFGAMWRSGSLMFDESVKSSLKLSSNEQIIGFLYLGTPKKFRASSAVNSSDFVSYATL